MLWMARKAARKLRRMLWPPAPPPPLPPVVVDPIAKAAKLERVRPLLRLDLPHEVHPLRFDFLTPELRQQFNIVDTANVSSNNYDETAQEMIRKYADGLILDCGAGLRRTDYPNVVNFEICDYPSTDVRGVGECLPFRDGSFDAVFSFAVLEHVKDPWACAREIARVLKPGGELYCVVPFLQPLHGYPHHYFNMSHQGLRTLFEAELDIVRQAVIPSGLPIWTLTWILERWAASLPPRERFKFLGMRVADLIGNPVELLGQPFVTELPESANWELASTTALWAKKPTTSRESRD